MSQMFNRSKGPSTSMLGGSAGNNGIMSKISGATSGVGLNTILIALFVCIFIAVTYFLFRKQLNALFSPGFRANNENVPIGGPNGGEGSSVELLFFSTQWCPHCKTAKPEWEQVVSEYQDKQINGRTVVFTEVDCTNETSETEKMMNQYKIEGFPTIKLLKDGQVIEFDAKPTKATLVQFLNTAL